MPSHTEMCLFGLALLTLIVQCVLSSIGLAVCCAIFATTKLMVGTYERVFKRRSITFLSTILGASCAIAGLVWGFSYFAR
jgi:hypothetical protein